MLIMVMVMDLLNDMGGIGIVFVIRCSLSLLVSLISLTSRRPLRERMIARLYGQDEIRTHGTGGTSYFKYGALNRSATCPKPF